MQYEYCFLAEKTKENNEMSKGKVFKMVGVVVSLVGFIIACIATLVTPFFDFDKKLSKVADELGVDMSGKLLNQQGGVAIVGIVIGIAAIGLLGVLVGKAVVTIVFGIIEVAFSILYSVVATATLAEYSKWVSNGSGVTLMMVAGIVITVGGIVELVGNIMKKKEANL